MGCCHSSPYTYRIYRDPADLDECYEGEEPKRTFGRLRNNSNLMPDDLEALPNPYMYQHLAVLPSECLYEAEIDQGSALRCLRPWLAVIFCPPIWAWVAATGVASLLGYCNCDHACCWVRKEYSTRTYIRVYSNRIEQNQPTVRIPFGYLGCGSWNADAVSTNPFDRGAFGFRRVTLSFSYLCCCLPVYGGAVARQRCQCNGSLWPRICSDCGGCWCDEWLCDICFCSYRYTNLADPDEFAFAASISLQAYFEGRAITKADMDKCILYWRNNISEKTAPEKRKRAVCCEEHIAIPNPFTGILAYRNWTHVERKNPYLNNRYHTPQLKAAYKKFNELRIKQLQNYTDFIRPTRTSTCCRLYGCRRCCGRRGLCFCTEDCDKCCSHKVGDPAPPFSHPDWDDDNDAAKVLQRVLGPPPKNVLYIRQNDTATSSLSVFPLESEREQGIDQSDVRDEENVSLSL